MADSLLDFLNKMDACVLRRLCLVLCLVFWFLVIFILI